MVNKELENAKADLEAKLKELQQDKADAMKRHDDAIEQARIELLAVTDMSRALAAKRSFVPEKDTRYYYMDDCMECAEATWSGHARDEARLKAHNVYAQKQQCEFECEAARVGAELMEYASTDANRLSYFCIIKEGLPGGNCNIVLVEMTHPVSGSIYFSTESIARGALAFVGEERVKKYYQRPRIGRYWEDPVASSDKVNDADDAPREKINDASWEDPYEKAKRTYFKSEKLRIDDRID